MDSLVLFFGFLISSGILFWFVRTVTKTETKVESIDRDIKNIKDDIRNIYDIIIKKR